MTKMLLRLFVKNFKDTQNPAVRANAGKMSGIVGIVLNLLLASAKIVVGALFGVLSVLADGLNNLTDCGSNVVSLVGIKLASKPADGRHPFGHRRMEYVASMAVAFIVLLLAVQLGIESVTKIVAFAKGQADAVEFNVWLIVALSTSVLVKLWMFAFNFQLAKRYAFPLLKASAIDSISDACATSAVLIAIVISHYAGINLDGFMGLIVAVFIAFAGAKILKGTANQLVGEAPDKELTDKIERRIKSYDGVLGMHDLNVHNYGPDKFYASVHMEVDAAVNVMDSHDLADRIERDFLEHTNVTLVTHIDPIVVGNAETDAYKAQVDKIVKSIDEHFVLHDFRMVKGNELVNLIFDVAVHFDTEMTDREISDYIQTEVDNLYQNVFVAVTVERQISDDVFPKKVRRRKK
ncbi:MAG: cation diffusion facilitator family transporter [Corallococcus sp.]|nr:cation diffusion facilitator family transporter [Corallococcus sp.]MCM1395299.1 cation diffusion facilitator family transporter [Corallococcus sp.]